MPTNTKAFTLIELIVGILIIGILATVAITQYKNSILKAQASKLANVIDQARKAGQLWMLANYPEDKTFYDTGVEAPYGEEHLDNLEQLEWSIPSLSQLEKDLHFRLMIYSGTQKKPFFAVQAEPIDNTTGFSFYYVELQNGESFCGGGGKIGEYLNQLFNCQSQ